MDTDCPQLILLLKNLQYLVNIKTTPVTKNIYVSKKKNFLTFRVKCKQTYGKHIKKFKTNKLTVVVHLPYA